MRRRALALTVAVLALAALNVGLLVAAFRMGDAEVTDGVGSVTTGTITAWAIVAALVGVVGLELAHRHRVLMRSTQAFVLGGMALHATGHLERWYYRFPMYDDVLHFAVTGVAAVLAVRHAQAFALFPPRHSTRLRASLLAVVCALALAGGWELFEFSMDQLQGTREQDDLVDTMWDMLAGLAGGVLAGFWLAARPRPAVVRKAPVTGS